MSRKQLTHAILTRQGGAKYELLRHGNTTVESL